ncbi:MAG: sbtB [Glaciihabitans sp.]|nr:sbtB [Glaciihabitans sp.]
MRALSLPSTSARRKAGRAGTAVALAAGAALLGALFSAPAVSAAPAVASATSKSDFVPSLKAVTSTVKNYKAGTYIVTLKDAPAASYTGGVNGFKATKPVAGEQLNTKSDAVKQYRAYLADKQKSLTSKVGVKAIYSYSIATNGFAAYLTPADAARLAKSSGVAHVTPAERLKPQAESSLDFLKVSTPGGLWDKIGGQANAGKGVVVGDIDTGIAPENPSFAGDPLGTTPTVNKPYLSGSTVVYTKSDGNTFTDTPDLGAPGELYPADGINSKIIGAHYYVAGFGAANVGTHSTGEYLSPRDGDGHGSHTASTAAGNFNVPASVGGQVFDNISGVAPAAKISVYKVCWSGPDPESSADDACTTPDIIAAIDQAVADGVDVINFSIGSSSGATTTYSPTDAAYLSAAAAGVFVAAAGGNSGPGASTLDNAAPWETTVAASTIPPIEATVVLGNGKKYAGLSITVTQDPTAIPLSAPLVLASTIPASGVTSADAALCGPDTLNPAGASGKIVVCDRGSFLFAQKGDEVHRVNGAGMIIVNVPGGSTGLVNTLYPQPTVHLPVSARSPINSYALTAANPTATFLPGNLTTTKVAVPQIADFSSRGPVLADGSDILKPDIAAPGVDILAAYTNVDRTPEFAFLQGTSMATPHIAGLAAVYLSVRPLASPAEIKSAMMTTANNTVDNAGKSVTDPFKQGAGEVKPTSFLNAGLVYLNDVTDWKRYLVGVGEATYPGVSGIDASNLNLASIAVGDLTSAQKVTRTVTSLGSGTYTATASVPGVKATVSPSTLSFTAAGQSKTFTVTFSRTTAAVDKYATGFLTWKRTSGSTTVRSPIVIHPTSIVAPSVITGTGTGGHVGVPVTTGASVPIRTQTLGLAEGVLTTPHGTGPDAYTDIATTGGYANYVHHVGPGSELVRFNVKPVIPDPNEDLDLYVFYYQNQADIPADISPADAATNTHLIAVSATTSANETVDLFAPDAGYYVTLVDYFSVPNDGRYKETFTDLNPDTAVGNLTVTPASFQGSTGASRTLDLRWGGLTPNRDYLGFLLFNNAAGSTLAQTPIFISSGDALAPVNLAKPTVKGMPHVGETLTVNEGTWDAENSLLDFSYQWLADGDAIGGATDSSYDILPADAGKDLSVIVTAKLASGGPDAPVRTAVSNSVHAVLASSVTFTVTPDPLTSSSTPTVHVVVSTSPAATADTPITGTVKVSYSNHTKSATLTAASDGVANITLPKLSKGKHTIFVVYSGGEFAAPATSAKLVVIVQ